MKTGSSLPFLAFDLPAFDLVADLAQQSKGSVAGHSQFGLHPVEHLIVYYEKLLLSI